MKYYIKYTLEIKEYDEKTGVIKPKGITIESNSAQVARPDVYIKKVLAKQSRDIAQLIIEETKS